VNQPQEQPAGHYGNDGWHRAIPWLKVGGNNTGSKQANISKLGARQDEISDLPKQANTPKGPAEILRSRGSATQRQARWLPFISANV